MPKRLPWTLKRHLNPNGIASLMPEVPDATPLELHCDRMRFPKVGGDAVNTGLNDETPVVFSVRAQSMTHSECMTFSNRIGDHVRLRLVMRGVPMPAMVEAGEQVGWGDKRRGTVFWNIIEILRARKPRLVLLENVAHFVRHDEGKTYRKVRAALEAEGYTVDHHQFSPHQFRVPQIRERFYMVGVRGLLDSFRWPEQETTAGEVSIRSVLDANPPEAAPLSAQVTRCLEVWQEFLDRLPEPIKLPSFPVWAMEFGATYPYDRDHLDEVSLTELQAGRGPFGTPLRGFTRPQIMSALPSHAQRNGVSFPRWKKTFLQQNREFYQEHRARLHDWLPKLAEFPSSLQKFEWNCQGASRDLWKLVIQFRASGVRVKCDNTAPSLVAMTTTQVPIVAWEHRYMTVRECARLQSLDALGYLPTGGAAVSALGNAVNVAVVRRILRRMLPLLETPMESSALAA